MVDSSKILTVSYGTFSCTLEGFDDSFGTMKAIAEYFRDLAADDRYFGAEPPTPDVHMLAKIAEREITRHVDASTQDGSIVLRASEAVAPAMPPQAERPDPVQVAAAAVVPRMKSTPTDHTLDDFQKALSDATATEAEPVAGLEAEDQPSSPLVVSSQVTSSEMTFEDMEEEAPAVVTPLASESVAAKLQRIRSAVSKSAPMIDIADFAEDLSEVEASEAAEAAEEVIVEDVEVEVEVEVAETETAETKIDLAELSLGDDQLAEDIAASQSEYDDEVMDDPAPAVVAEDNNDDAMLSSLQAKFSKAAPAEDPVAEEKPEVRAKVLRLRKTTTKESAETVADDDIKSDTATDDAVDDLADVAAMDGADVAEATASTTLSVEDEADLMEELAALEADFETAPAAEEKKPRHTLPDTDDATMSHILSQTDQELNEPEGNRRRNAIAQLKAAVAATEAARQLGDDASDTSEAEEAFREDFNDAVRPASKKSVEEESRPSRPEPLKLVASQRVDMPTGTTAEPVHPRRVAVSQDDDSANAEGGFAGFAQEMGAHSLSELLEAAAAYTSFVEGNEDFSRPQIMKKVQFSSEAEFSREDGLRTFGKLLRQGLISKGRNGRFQVAEGTRFRPESEVG